MNGSRINWSDRNCQDEDGLYDRGVVLNVVVDGKGKAGNGHAVMAIALRMDASEFLEIVHRLGNRIHEVVENPGALGLVEVLGFDKVEFSEGGKLWSHVSERGAAGVETGLDVGPVVDGMTALALLAAAIGIGGELQLLWDDAVVATFDLSDADVYSFRFTGRK